MNVAERIREVLAIDPDADAIEFDGRWISWGAVSAVANALDERLREAELGEGTTVGILLRNRPALMSALVGVLASERCVVTINPIQGAAKLCDEIRSLELPALVAEADDWAIPGLAEAARSAGSAGLQVGSDPPACGPVHGLDRPGPGSHREPLPGVAVEMLTSGTTGPPKRVHLRYASLGAAFADEARRYGKQGEGDAPRLATGIVIVHAPLIHVSGIYRSLGAVLAGRRISLVERFTVEGWHQLVLRHQPKTSSLVPTAVRMVLDADLPREDLVSLKAVTSGTAPLSPDVADAFLEKYGIPVLTLYGATEFAGGVAGWTYPDHQKFGVEKRGSAGRANPGVDLRVVDRESGDVLPTDGVGLLEVRSPQLGSAGDWVRTTDLARIDADGFLFIQGRADDAILRGGFKIAPGDVVAALQEHPAVAEASVVGLPDERLGAVPVAAVLLDPSAPPVSEDELLAFAREHLTGYQVPSQLRIVDTLPRTPSLKVSQPAVRALFGDDG